MLNSISNNNNGYLLFFTIINFMSYILMSLGLIPQLEIFNTIFSLLSVGCLFFWCVFFNKIKTSRVSFVAFIIFSLFVLAINIINSIHLNNINDFIYNANAISIICLVFVFLVNNNKSLINEISIRYVLISVVLFAVCSSIFNIYVNYESIMNLAAIRNAYEAKFTGFFLGRNQFGAYLYLSIVSCFYLENIYDTKVSVFIVLFLILNLLFTFSRTPILCTLLFLIISKLKFSNPKIIFGSIMLTSIFVGFYVFTSIGDLADKFLIRSDVGSAGRISRWMKLLMLVINEPSVLLGISPAGFKAFMLQNNFGFAHIDNAYLEILISYGIVGVFIYTVFLVYCLFFVYKTMTVRSAKKVMIGFFFSFLLFDALESMILFEAGLVQLIATVLFVVIPKSLCSDMYSR